MSLSNDIITHQLDPVLFDQYRCEFRIDPKVWLSNWRLADLGCVLTTSGTIDGTAQSVRYASHLGAYALIDRIRLLNGTVEIAELRNVKQYIAFKNLQRTNANAFNVNRVLNKSSFAFDLELDTTPKMAVKDYAQWETSITADAATTPLSYLDLTQVLPFLKAQSYVLGTELQSLRLIIDWVPITTATIKSVFVGQTMPTGIAIIKPTLLLDEVADKANVNKLKNSAISYINWDHEVVNLDAVTTSPQIIQQRLRGFDDKMVRRVLMINEDVSNSQPSAYMGGMTSNAMYKEKINFTLNGQKMLNYGGIETSNQKLAMLNDNFGTHIFPQGAQFFDLQHKDKLFKAHDVFNDATKIEANNLVGQMSYLGINVSSNIDELLLEYQRETYSVSIEKSATALTVGATTSFAVAAHGYAAGDVITISGVTGETASKVILLNASHTIAVTDDDNFTVPVATANITGLAPTVGATTTLTGSAGDFSGVAVGDVVTVSGFTGDDAGDINGDQTIATIVAGGGAITVSANTTGKTITGSAGIVALKLVGSAAKTTTATDTDKETRSKSKCNLLFWGEVSKTMTVTNNNVSIGFN